MSRSKKCVNYAGPLLTDNRDIHKEKVNKVFKIDSNFISQNYKFYIYIRTNENNDRQFIALVVFPKLKKSCLYNIYVYYKALYIYIEINNYY